MHSVPFHFLVVLALLAAGPAGAQEPPLPFDVPPLEGPPPEAPLPPPPPRLPAALPAPLVTAPDARTLLEGCDESTFTDCFRLWQPPPPPPPPAQASAPSSAPLPPGSPRQPAESGALTGGRPPPPDPVADQATYDALAKAIREAGLEGKIQLGDPPEAGSTIMTLEPSSKSPSPKR